MTLESLKTDWLPKSKLSLNTERAKAYTSVLSSSLRIIQSILGMFAELESDFWGNVAKNAWNWCDWIHCCQTWVPSRPYIFAPNTSRLIMSLFVFHIYCFRPNARILYQALIHNTIVTDLNLTISLILLRATFSLYSKLSHILTSLLLKACSLMNAVLDVIIFPNFLKKMLYKTDKPK